ncbi:sugar phosphate isomerase/epimerase family protein [Natronobacterium haloterrestre]|nr:sugar phosphate isomerase/epimerase [Halobiforma haloterrestris]
MPRTAINLYSVRNLDADLESVLRRVADAGYDGVQFAGDYSPLHAEPATVAATLRQLDLAVAPPHVDLETLRTDREAIREAFAPLEVDAIVLPWLDEAHFASAEAVDAIADDLAALESALEADGLDLLYHNHDHEYTALEEGAAYDRFLRQTTVGIELDVGWALVGGDDPARRIRNLGDRVGQLHMKDMTTGSEPTFTELGEGDVDIAACVDAAREVDVDWLIYEHDDPDDPAASLERGATALEGRG